MSDQRNDNITFSGGTFHGPVAAGANAQANQYGAGVPVSDGAALRAQLAEVRRLIEERASELDDPASALRDADDVEAEVSRDRPDTRRLSDALSRLGDRVVKVAAVATAVVKLGEMVRDAVS